MRPQKTAVIVTAFVVLVGGPGFTWLTHANAQTVRASETTKVREFSDAGKAALSSELSRAVARGDTLGLGFQIASADPQDTKHRSPGSLSWAGIYNTEFWIDPVKHIGGIQMMHVLPFYDDGAIRTLRDFEKSVYQNFR
jgi:CubicO group peptidase (beta-lactamase class C family)